MLKSQAIICGMLSTNHLVQIPKPWRFQLSTVCAYFSPPFIQHLAFTDPFCIIRGFWQGQGCTNGLEQLFWLSYHLTLILWFWFMTTDTMTNEQTWPTDEEMCGADADQLCVEAMDCQIPVSVSLDRMEHVGIR